MISRCRKISLGIKALEVKLNATVYPPGSYMWVYLISEENEVGIDGQEKKNLVEISCKLYLKSRWGWARACWIKSEVVGPTSSRTPVVLKFGPHNYVFDGQSFRKEFPQEQLSPHQNLSWVLRRGDFSFCSHSSGEEHYQKPLP